MKFQKIDIPQAPKYKGSYWIMLIDNIVDLIKYNEAETDLMGSALINQPKDRNLRHITGNREKVLDKLIQIEHTKDKPKSAIEVTSKLINTKFINMLKGINDGKTLLINRNGGYCYYDSFVNIWNSKGFKVLEEIEKDSTWFPTDYKPISSDVVFLENAESINTSFYLTILNKFKLKYENVIKLTSLKEQDPKYIFEVIQLTKKVVIETEFVNQDQNDKMFEMFLKLTDSKTFIVKTTPEGKKDIMGHKNYSNFIKKHKLIWF